MTCSARSGRSEMPTTLNALAESFVDTFKTELIADRVWCTRGQLELAIVEWVAWFNNDRLHESLGDLLPAEFEQLHAAKASISGNGSVTELSPKAADRLYAPPLERGRANGHLNGTLSADGAEPGPADAGPASISQYSETNGQSSRDTVT
jgi:hypothetical protein